MILIIGIFGGVWDLGSDLESSSFFFWVVWRLECLGSDGGCFLDFFDWFEGFGSDDGGGSFLLVGSLSLGWLGLKGFKLWLFGLYFGYDLFTILVGYDLWLIFVHFIILSIIDSHELWLFYVAK